MTQAISYAHILRDAGHEIVSVDVGLGQGWTIPEWFEERIGHSVRVFQCPVHVLDPTATRVDAGSTLRNSLRRFPDWTREVLRRASSVAPDRVDLQIGFFDILGGWAQQIRRRAVPRLAVGHHYVLRWTDEATLRGAGLSWSERRFVRSVTAMSGWRSQQLALAFAPAGAVHGGGEEGAVAPDIWTVPPLLRPDFRELEAARGDFLLVYAVAPGVARQVVAWQRSRPEARVRIYVSGGASGLDEAPGDGCSVHELDDRAFLRDLAACRAYAGSAGFESVCEAHALGKPILAVPTEGQVEQRLNAADAERHGVARTGTWGDLDTFWTEATPPSDAQVDRFRRWIASAPEIFLERAERAAA